MSELVRFGVVTDVQYADNDDRVSWYEQTKIRYYRNSLSQVSRAFERWNSDHTHNTGSKISFVLQLGDIIDGINKDSSHDSSLNAIQRTLQQFESNPHIPTFHAVGNHELYNFKRQDLARLFQESLLKRMKIDSDSIGLNSLKLLPENPKSCDEMMLYYKFTPCAGVKFISLDCFDISVLGHDKTHPNYLKAADILYQHHGHYDYEGWDTDVLLKDSNKRFQSCNGAISEEQLKWIDEELEESDSKNELVIVFGHVGLHPESCSWDTIMWNYEEVIACFNRHPSVIAHLCGHSHNHGYAYANGVHYLVFNAIIETPPDQESFATITVCSDRIEVEGHGLEQSRVLHLQNRRQQIMEEKAIVNECLEEISDDNNLEETPTIQVEV